MNLSENTVKGYKSDYLVVFKSLLGYKEYLIKEKGFKSKKNNKMQDKLIKDYK